MRIQVLFFGMLRDLTGRSEESLELPDGARLETVFDHYASQFPRLREMASSIVLARNQEFARPDVLLGDGDEVALMPPVSGGSRGAAQAGPNGAAAASDKSSPWLASSEDERGFYALTNDPIDVDRPQAPGTDCRRWSRHRVRRRRPRPFERPPNALPRLRMLRAAGIAKDAGDRTTHPRQAPGRLYCDGASSGTARYQRGQRGYRRQLRAPPAGLRSQFGSDQPAQKTGTGLEKGILRGWGSVGRGRMGSRCPAHCR